jgi:hypothetical protein
MGLTSGCASRARAKASALSAGSGDLEAVFAGVAAARDEQSAPFQRAAAGHEHQFFDAGQKTGRAVHGLRALQGQQGAVGLGGDGRSGADAQGWMWARSPTLQAPLTTTNSHRPG